MGSDCSKEINPKRLQNNVNLYKLMKGGAYFNDQNTINFSRKDLLNTLSDTSILDVMRGGGEKLKHYPKRDRYSKYETQQIKNHNQNLHGGHQLSTVSDQEMQTLRNLITQQGGCGCGNQSPVPQKGGCGCGENSVLRGGFKGRLNESATSSFMPGNISDLSATSNTSNSSKSSRNEIFANASATSSFMPRNISDLSITSQSQRGGMSPTSEINPEENIEENPNEQNQIEENPNEQNQVEQNQVEENPQSGGLSSSTSDFATSDRKLHYNPQLQQYQYEQYNHKLVNNRNNNSESAMERLTNLVGNNIQMGGAINRSDFSATSSQPIKYEELVGSGWGKKSKKQKGGARVDEPSSTSSSVTSSTSTSSKSSTPSDDEKDIAGRISRQMARTESTESTVEQKDLTVDRTSPSESSTESSTTTEESEMSRLNALERTKTDTASTRSSKASSSSSSGSTPSSSNGSASSSSGSTSPSTFDSSSSSSSRSENSKTVKRNIYLSTTASEGNVIDAKQFYSSDQGELYSSDTNYLRHNLTKRRFR